MTSHITCLDFLNYSSYMYLKTSWVVFKHNVLHAVPYMTVFVVGAIVVDFTFVCSFRFCL